jgi:hypothetical protein
MVQRLSWGSRFWGLVLFWPRVIHEGAKFVFQGYEGSVWHGRPEDDEQLPSSHFATATPVPKIHRWGAFFLDTLGRSPRMRQGAQWVHGTSELTIAWERSLDAAQPTSFWGVLELTTLWVGSQALAKKELCKRRMHPRGGVFVSLSLCLSK